VIVLRDTMRNIEAATEGETLLFFQSTGKKVAHVQAKAIFASRILEV